jgi:hypothetical protein
MKSDLMIGVVTQNLGVYVHTPPHLFIDKGGHYQGTPLYAALVN